MTKANKVEIRPIKEENKFEPFELVIRIEHIDELKSLYHRAFPTCDTIKEISQAVGFELPSPEIDDNLVEAICDKVFSVLKQYQVPLRNFKKEEN